MVRLNTAAVAIFLATSSSSSSSSSSSTVVVAAAHEEEEASSKMTAATAAASTNHAAALFLSHHLDEVIDYAVPKMKKVSSLPSSQAGVGRRGLGNLGGLLRHYLTMMGGHGGSQRRQRQRQRRRLSKHRAHHQHHPDQNHLRSSGRSDNHHHHDRGHYYQQTKQAWPGQQLYQHRHHHHGHHHHHLDDHQDDHGSSSNNNMNKKATKADLIAEHQVVLKECRPFHNRGEHGDEAPREEGHEDPPQASVADVGVLSSSSSSSSTTGCPLGYYCVESTTSSTSTSVTSMTLGGVCVPTRTAKVYQRRHLQQEQNEDDNDHRHRHHHHQHHQDKNKKDTVDDDMSVGVVQRLLDTFCADRTHTNHVDDSNQSSSRRLDATTATDGGVDDGEEWLLNSSYYASSSMQPQQQLMSYSDYCTCSNINIQDGTISIACQMPEQCYASEEPNLCGLQIETCGSVEYRLDLEGVMGGNNLDDQNDWSSLTTFTTCYHDTVPYQHTTCYTMNNNRLSSGSGQGVDDRGNVAMDDSEDDGKMEQSCSIVMDGVECSLCQVLMPDPGQEMEDCSDYGGYLDCSTEVTGTSDVCYAFDCRNVLNTNPLTSATPLSAMTGNTCESPAFAITADRLWLTMGCDAERDDEKTNSKETAARSGGATAFWSAPFVAAVSVISLATTVLSTLLV